MKFGIRELVLVVILLGTLGASWFFLFRVSNEKQAKLRNEIQQRQRELGDLQRATTGVDDLAGKITELQQAIDFFEGKLPQEKEIDKILKEVWQMAEANSLQTKTIKTLKSERYNQYSEQPIQMSLVGDFNGFYAFLLQLEKLPRITRLMQMNLSRIPDHDGEMNAQMTLSIFFEPDAGASSVASAAQ